MTSEIERLAGALMVGLEPIVFMVCGVYAGAVYGGIVGALRGARTELAPAIAVATAGTFCRPGSLASR
jgi:hypothetical protein